jgi:hypothetical protein
MFFIKNIIPIPINITKPNKNKNPKETPST